MNARRGFTASEIRLRFYFHRVIGLYNNQAQMGKTIAGMLMQDACPHGPIVPCWIKQISAEVKNAGETPYCIKNGCSRGVSETDLLLIDRKAVLRKKQS